jgi:hypothetical protein
MSKLPVNLREIDVMSFPVYPPGKYTLRIDETRQEAAKSSGELKLTVSFEIVDGPNGSNEFAGKKLLSSYSLQQQALFRLKKLVIACGISDDQLPADGLDDQLLIGCQITSQIQTEKYQGRDVNRVTGEEPASGPAIPVTVTPAPAPAGFAAPPAAAPSGNGHAQPPVPPPPGWAWDPTTQQFVPATQAIAPTPPPAAPGKKAPAAAKKA